MNDEQQADLWACYEWTGEDCSGGRYPGWQTDAVRAVEEQRAELDSALEIVDGLRDIIGQLYVQRGSDVNNLRAAIRRAFRESKGERDA